MMFSTRLRENFGFGKEEVRELRKSVFPYRQGRVRSSEERFAGSLGRACTASRSPPDT